MLQIYICPRYIQWTKHYRRNKKNAQRRETTSQVQTFWSYPDPLLNPAQMHEICWGSSYVWMYEAKRNPCKMYLVTLPESTQQEKHQITDFIYQIKKSCTKSIRTIKMDDIPIRLPPFTLDQIEDEVVWTNEVVTIAIEKHKRRKGRRALSESRNSKTKHTV